MAHQLEVDEETGKAAMFYCGDVPWHGLGTKLNNPPTVEDAIHLAGLDWAVERRALVLKDDTAVEVPAVANVRSSDQKVLGVVGKNYRPFQNIEAFKWFQPFLDSGEVELHTAGSLRGGTHIWVLAKVKKDPIEIVKGDEVLQFILLSNSHNGTTSVRPGFTGIRVVCANTVAAALTAAESRLLTVRHTEKTVEAMEKVREAMNLGRSRFEATTEGMKQMARKGVTTESLKAYIHTVFEPKLTLDTADAKERLDRLAGRVIPLFEKGRGNDLPGVKGTVWGAYNAVTELLTWERGRSNDTRLQNLWLGDAANLAQRAFTEALKIAA